VAQQNENLYEVTLNLEVHAKYEVDVIYHLELSYGGLFRLRKIPEELRQQVLIGNCPKLLFPSFRRVVSDITHHGGFPPLMLNFGSFSGLAKAAILAQKERRVDSAQEATHILAECQRE
jgi:protein-export chaperone SecB